MGAMHAVMMRVLVRADALLQFVISMYLLLTALLQFLPPKVESNSTGTILVGDKSCNDYYACAYHMLGELDSRPTSTSHSFFVLNAH